MTRKSSPLPEDADALIAFAEASDGVVRKEKTEEKDLSEISI
jgi:hypothetical protein